MQYATRHDLATFMFINFDGLDSKTDRMLRNASDLIDSAILGRMDHNNPLHVEKVRDAVCAQVEYWMESGDQTDNNGSIQSYTAGNVSVTYGADRPTGAICRRARAYLNRCGLLYRGVGR